MNNTNLRQRGFLPILGIIIVAAALVVGGYYWGNGSEKAAPGNSAPSNTDVSGYPSSIPLATQNQNATPTLISNLAYVNAKVGFSATISDDGTWSAPNSDLSVFKIGEMTPHAVWVYASDARGNVWAGISVWQNEVEPCFLGTASSITKNRYGFSVASKDSSDAAMGHYEKTYVRSIFDGKKDYCVVGQVKGTRHYDLEGKAYDDAEKIDAADIKRFEADFNLFVDTFKIL